MERRGTPAKGVTKNMPKKSQRLEALDAE